MLSRLLRCRRAFLLLLQNTTCIVPKITNKHHKIEDVADTAII